MKKYTFNVQLFRNINLSLQRKYKEIAASCGFPETSFKYWRHDGDIRVSKLVTICNTFKIPVSDFVCTEQEQQQRTEPLKDFTPIEWRIDNLGDDLVGCNSINETIDRLDIPLVNFYRRFRNNGDSILTIREYLEICNKHNIYPGDYLVDFNKNIIVLQGFSPKHESVSEQIKKLRKRNKELENKNKVLQGRLKNKEAELESVSEQMQKMCKRIKELEINNNKLMERLNNKDAGQSMSGL